MNGSDLKAWRKNLGATQEVLATELDVTRQTVIGWESSEAALPKMLVLALKELERTRSFAGRRLTAPERKDLRSRPDEPGSKAARASKRVVE